MLLGQKVITDLGEQQEYQGLICRPNGRSTGAHFHGEAAERGQGSSLVLCARGCLGCKLSHKLGLFLVQSCSSAKTKAQEQPQLEAETRRDGSRTLGEGQSMGDTSTHLQRGLLQMQAWKGLHQREPHHYPSGALRGRGAAAGTGRMQRKASL